MPTILIVICVMTLAACGGGDSGDGARTTAGEATSSSPEATAATPDSTVAASGAGMLRVADSELGSILVDDEGVTLYLFQPDDQGQSTCYDQCADNWPALTGPVEAGEGVDGSLLATVERDDGTAQVTYNSWPLYYFINDVAPGDVNGQGVNDVWWVVDPAGAAVVAG